MRGVSGWCWSVQIESVVAVAVASDVVLPDQVAAEDALDTLAAARLLLAVHSGQNFMGGNLSPSVCELLEQMADHGDLPGALDRPRLVGLGGDDQRVGVPVEANR